MVLGRDIKIKIFVFFLVSYSFAHFNALLEKLI